MPEMVNVNEIAVNANEIIALTEKQPVQSRTGCY